MNMKRSKKRRRGDAIELFKLKDDEMSVYLVFRKFVKKLKLVFSEEKYILIVAFSTAIILFLYSFSLGLTTIPIFNVGVIRMTAVSILDVIFMFVFSLIAGVSIAFYLHSKGNVRGVCTLSGGIFAGYLTSFCPFCPVVFLTLFGASITLEFIASYFPILRMLSLTLLLLSLYLSTKNIKLERLGKKHGA